MERRIREAQQAFAPTLATSSARYLKPSIVETVDVIALPNTAQESDYKALMFLLMMLGTSDSTDGGHWKAFVVTFCLAVFPGLARDTEVASSISVRLIDAKQMNTIQRWWVSRLKITTEPQVEDFAADGMALAGNLIKGMEPDRPLGQLYKIVDSSNIRVMFTYLSLIIFLASKIITTENVDSIESARPRAIISKYFLAPPDSPDGVISALNGDAKMSRAAHRGINRAWIEMPAFRIPALALIIETSLAGRDIAHDILATTIKLMEYSQMMHSVFCSNLLAAEPWIATWPPLAPSVQVFLLSSEKLQTLPVLLRPYAKIVYGDRAKFFPRREMLPMIECAISCLKATSKTIGNYYTDPAYESTVQSFTEEKARREAAERRRERRHGNALYDMGYDSENDSDDIPVRRQVPEAPLVVPAVPRSRPLSVLVEDDEGDIIPPDDHSSNAGTHTTVEDEGEEGNDDGRRPQDVADDTMSRKDEVLAADAPIVIDSQATRAVSPRQTSPEQAPISKSKEKRLKMEAALREKILLEMAEERASLVESTRPGPSGSTSVLPTVEPIFGKLTRGDAPGINVDQGTTSRPISQKRKLPPPIDTTVDRSSAPNLPATATSAQSRGSRKGSKTGGGLMSTLSALAGGGK